MKVGRAQPGAAGDLAFALRASAKRLSTNVDATCEPMNSNARVVRWIIAKPSSDWRLQLAWVIMGSGWAGWV